MSDVTGLIDWPAEGDGGVAVIDDATGQPVPAGDGDPVFLCRCGESQNKPFCDGARKRNGFQGAVATLEPPAAA